ncbi:MAG: hypothetical protein K0R94_1510 [Burkholderiales bacterium]|jgi:hypothetical protein|nr:hypothetical protein [Burkholderiales bacterium]
MDNVLRTPLINISQDGIHWQAAKIDTSGLEPNFINITSIACNKIKCIASDEDGDGLLYSDDNGLSWKSTRLSFENSFQKVIYSNDKLYGNGVYVYANGYDSKYSYDAIHWNSATNKQK